MKVRLIAGTINHRQEDGWLNVHLDVSARPLHLSLPDHDEPAGLFVLPDIVVDISDESAFRTIIPGRSFDEVRLHHVLEHLSRPAGRVALGNLHYCLKPDGILDVEVPDVYRVMHAWLADEIDDDAMEQWIYGEHLAHHEPGDSHRAGYTERVLREKLEQAGFVVGEREETGLALRFRAVAVHAPEEFTHDDDG